MNDNDTGRLLFSSDAEASVIGALLLDNDALDRIDDRLTPADFYVGAYREIYTAVRGLLHAGKKADAVTVQQAMEIAGTLEGAGGIKSLVNILQNTPGSTNIAHYAKIVRERAMERALLMASDEINGLARSTGPVAGRMDAAQALILKITEDSVDSEPRPIKPFLAEFIEELELRNERKGELMGLSTTIGDLDRKTAGLHPGQLIIVAGRPGMGKTSLAVQIAVRAALADKTSAIFSMEMSGKELAEKCVSNVGKINTESLRKGELTEEEWERVSSSMGRLHEKNLIIDETGGLSVEQISARSRRIKRKHGLSLVVVDYLQLMHGDGDNRTEQVGHISRGLKALAKDLGVPVIALSQLNRSVESRSDKRPQMSDLRESGAIEQDADVIVFIYRDEVYNKETDARGVAELIVAKQRMGPIGTVPSTFIGEFGLFADTEWRRPDKDAPEAAPKRESKGFDNDF